MGEWTEEQERKHAAIVDQLRRAGWERWEALEEADRITAAAPDLLAETTRLRAEVKRLREVVARIPKALNDAFAAGAEEREGGSIRRQAKALESVEALRAEARAARTGAGHYVLAEERDRLRAEVERLQAELSSGSFYKESDIDALQSRAESAEKEVERLREACNQARLAFAGYVSVQSAIDALDRRPITKEPTP